MKYHEVSGSLYACEKVYQWLSAKIGDDGDDFWVGAYGTWSEFKGNVARYRKKTV